MRKVFIILVLLWFWLPVLVSATTINAASCSYNAVQAAISSASSGDTVIVPSGTCAWDTELVISKGIYLIGAGSGNTIITSNYNNGDGHLIVYTPSDFSANNPFRISGFTFDLNDKCSAILLNGRPSLVIQTKIRIDHNTFTGVTSSYAYQGITNWGMRGVVDNNLWDNIPYPIRNDLAYRSGQEWWDNWEAVVFGKADNNIYLEDNIFTGLTIVADCAYANRYIFRYNTITAKAGAWPLFDMHGNQLGGSMWGCFGGELYGNQINSNYDVDLEDHRGGKMLIFMNNKNTTETNDAWYIQVRDTDPDSDNPTTNPSPQYPSDSYYWLNRRNLNGAFTSIQEGAHSDNPPLLDCPMENRDFFVGTDSFSGTMGMGYGPLGSRPATCTVGVGYWATDQSVSSLSGMVGKNPATPISGTLYKCTSTNTWTLYYTPYTYPHPLRTDCVNYPKMCDPSTTTINAASCSQQDVQAAIDSAQDGDTVLVPQGTCTWTTPHCYSSSNYCAAIQIVKKSVFLQGAGVDKTIIVNHVPYTWNNLAIYVQSQAGKPVRITGFTFTDEGYTYSTAIGIDGSSKNSRIDHCKFSKGLNRVAFDEGTEGIIDHCEFINPDVGVRINGDSNAAWSRPIIPGTNNAVFVEDNNFTLNSDFGSHQSDEMIYPQDGALPVVRYNTYNATTYARDDTPPLCSSHGNWGGVAPYYQDYRGQPIYEIYGNEVFLDRSYNPMFGGAWRGGSVIIFNNTVTKLRPNSNEPITGFTEEEGWTLGGLWCYPYWTPNTNYALGDKRQPLHYNGYYYQVTADNGVSGSTEPNWPAVVSASVNDGGLTWTNMGAAPCPIKITWPANDQVMNSFVWNNYFNGMPNDNTYLHQTTADGYGYDDVFIQQNRDYFLHAPESSGGREPYVMNSECTASGTPAPCCDGNGLGHCAAGHYDALIFIPSGPNAYYPYKSYIYPHPLTVAPFGTVICDEGAVSSSCWCEGMKSNGHCCHGYYQAESCYSGGGCVLPGDVNCDGIVNLVDLKLVASDFGKTSGFNNIKSDTNGNGVVDIYDAVFVASRFT